MYIRMHLQSISGANHLNSMERAIDILDKYRGKECYRPQMEGAPTVSLIRLQ